MKLFIELISLCLPAFLISTWSAAPIMAGPLLQEDEVSWGLELHSGQILSGNVEASSILVPSGAVVIVESDTVLTATGDIRIEGRFEIRDGQDVEGERNAPALSVHSDTKLTFLGSILGGRGASVQTAENAYCVYAQGGEGSTILLSSPDLMVGGELHPGAGGTGGTAADGGDAGSIVLRGRQLSSHGFSREALAAIRNLRQFFCAKGGIGGVGCDDQPNTGDSGDSSDVVADNDYFPPVDGDAADGELEHNLKFQSGFHQNLSPTPVTITDVLLFDTCADGEDGPPNEAPEVGANGERGGDGRDGTAMSPNGGDGGDAGNGSNVEGVAGIIGGDGVTCCLPYSPYGYQGGKGGKGGTGQSVVAGNGGPGGQGGDAYASGGVYWGDGGWGGDGGDGGDATAGPGGDGGNGGDGIPPGAQGGAGTAGASATGNPGAGGDGGVGLNYGLPGSGGSGGNGPAADPASPGDPGNMCPFPGG